MSDELKPLELPWGTEIEFPLIAGQPLRFKLPDAQASNTPPKDATPMTGDYKALEQYQTRPAWGHYFVSTVYQPGMTVLEPTAGNGIGFCQWIRPQDLTAVEIHPALAPQLARWTDNWHQADIETWIPEEAQVKGKRKLQPVYDLILGNLPYSRTEVIIRHLLPYLKPRGKIAILDRLSLLSSAARVDFWTNVLKPLSVTNVPRNVVVEIGGSGRYDLAWYVLGRRADYDNLRGTEIYWKMEVAE